MCCIARAAIPAVYFRLRYTPISAVYPTVSVRSTLPSNTSVAMRVFGAPPAPRLRSFICRPPLRHTAEMRDGLAWCLFFSLPTYKGGPGWEVGRLWQCRIASHDPHPQPLPTRG